jgi:aryl-alcohol dehydrogenase-like predicted oxidoreductase
MASVPTFTFRPLGIETSRVGFGCGALVGRHSFGQSARLIETALDLGIRYFDVAPLYGMGTAEEVLGAVVGGSNDVVIASKVGIPRPPYPTTIATARRITKPILDRSRALKGFARQLRLPLARPQVSAPQKRAPLDLSRQTISRDLDESLRLLRRSRIDVYLVHEPLEEDLDLATAEVFHSFLREGRIGCYGAAVTAKRAPWMAFGTVWQSGWGGSCGADYRSGTTYVFHGVVRNAPKDKLGRAVTAPSGLLRTAMAEAPEALFIIATSTPDKLRRFVAEVVD